MELVLKEIVTAAEVLLHGRPELINAVHRAAAGLPGEGFDIPASEWESLARHELNHLLTDPNPFDDGPAVAACLDWCSDPQDFRHNLLALSSHPESLSWEWFPDFVSRLREAGSTGGDVVTKLVGEVGDRCLRIGFALIELTEFKSSDDDDMYELLFIKAGAVDQLDAMLTAVGRRLLLCHGTAASALDLNDARTR
ncbi:hypothetical protein FOH10_16140 [Nocardia otitidiscaviarum]|uniref:DUF6630 domain-containing protein n=1 Tax=Nocardia otitidiscaviarum TaxID=1823 RepID=A0A516NM78_9NOCA|nr:hypothetical protein [Nocardia otitidiscaviarum]MCP9624844.1 hypothetical protein [Nocardia otitidiscaviarum]QDP80012.1 hypothetical protein FOH10_16140 [Nocardia otitidiscaviarum]